ncbi:MAG: hypothetical protein AAF170_07020 [Bacteroidota bacterium]
MTTSPRLARALTFIVLVGATTVLAPPADAQRRNTVPTYTLDLGGLELLFAATAEIAGSALTPRSNLSRPVPITLSDVTLLNNGSKGDSCGFEEGDTCNGSIFYRPSGTSSNVSCFRVSDVVINGALEDAASGVLTEEVTLNYTAKQKQNDCKPKED